MDVLNAASLYVEVAAVLNFPVKVLAFLIKV